MAGFELTDDVGVAVDHARQDDVIGEIDGGYSLWQPVGDRRNTDDLVIGDVDRLRGENGSAIDVDELAGEYHVSRCWSHGSTLAIWLLARDGHAESESLPVRPK